MFLSRWLCLFIRQNASKGKKTRCCGLRSTRVASRTAADKNEPNHDRSDVQELELFLIFETGNCGETA